MITEALVAFTWLLKFPLPAVEQNANQLTKQLFVLLKDYSKAGAARWENYLLVQNCFRVLRVIYACTGVTQVMAEVKIQAVVCILLRLVYLSFTETSAVHSQAITILVKNVKSNKISETQLQVLLGYAEEDIYDQSRQATAFGLLKVTSDGNVLSFQDI